MTSYMGMPPRELSRLWSPKDESERNDKILTMVPGVVRIGVGEPASPPPPIHTVFTPIAAHYLSIKPHVNYKSLKGPWRAGGKAGKKGW